MIRIKLKTFLFLFVLASILNAQQLLLKRIYIDDGSSSAQGLRSNIINCIALQGEQKTWIGTGQGLSFMNDSTAIFTIDTMTIVNEDSRFIYDAIAAITTQDSTVAFSSLTTQDGDPLGTGIYISENGLTDRNDWYRYDQPIDSNNDSLAQFGYGYFIARPLVGTRGVVSYNIDFEGDYLWITSWYGGLRRLKLDGASNWERVPLPVDNQDSLMTCDESEYEDNSRFLILKDYKWDSSDPFGNHNHKAFSVLAYGDTIWVGTANGINRGTLGHNGCVNWQHFFHPRDNLSGNWVLDIAKQEVNGEKIIWAITMNAILESEERSVSYTKNDGQSWEIVNELRGVRCHDISIIGSTVLIASDDGLWKSDGGENWELIPPAVEATPISSDEILTNIVYSVAGDNREYFDKSIFWIGTADGLARTYDINADNWQIYRAVADKEEVYAYPNPFSPFSHNQLNGDGWVRFNIGSDDIESVKLDIYNFAMEKVYSEKFDWRMNPGAVKWNGRDHTGELVPNGVYFVRVELSTNEEHWIKLVVVK